MKKKGEITTGIMISVFVGVIVALVLLTAVSPYIGQTSQTQTMSNVTFTPSGDLGTYVDLRGQELIGTPIVTNASSKDVIPASNYSIVERISSVDGLKRIGITIYDSASTWNASNINVSYTYGMEGYADSGGARSIILLIMTFAVLSVLVFTIYPVIKDRFLDSV